jgi:hypothetical protein
MTCREVWEQLVEEVTGQGREAPSKKSVHRWLKRWVEDGVLVLGGVLMEGPRKNVRIPSYLTPPIPPSRVGCEKECHLSFVGSNPSEEADLTNDTPPEKAPGVIRSEPHSTNDNPHSPRERVIRSKPVFAGVLPQRMTNALISVTDIDRTSESQDETTQEVHPPEDGGRTNGGQEVTGDCPDIVVTEGAVTSVTPEGGQQEDPPEWSDYRSAFR